MILAFIVLAISLSKLNTAIPIRCDGNTPNINSNINSNVIDYSNDYSDKSLIINHPIFDLMKVLGEKNVKKIYNDIKSGIETKITCDACKLALGLAKISVFSKTELNYLLAKTCSTFGIEDKRVCQGLSDLFTNELYFILKKTNLTNDEVCGILIGPKCMTNPCVKHNNWTIDLSINITKSTGNYDIILGEENIKPVEEIKFVQNKRKQMKKSVTKETLRILHLSDLHIDPYYEYGANADCGEPLCCRSTSAKSVHKKTAGYWGDYMGCDSPKYTIEQLMSQINTSLADQYEYLIWTGDIVAHDIWNTTKDTIINGSRSLTSLINNHISNGKLVFPVIGNHEGLPVNQFAPPEITGDLSIGWLYSELMIQWHNWIPNESADTFKLYGYYYNNVSPNIKVIVLNTNYCARLNFWLMYKPIDPGNQLEWMEKQLSLAEQSGQSVHIVGHIPPDSTQCTPRWVHNYLLIIERYNSIIKGQYFGHTHFDELRIQFSPNNKSIPIGVAYLTPSITTYEGVNPAFRMYTIDHMGTVLDHQNYYINLTKANSQYQSLEWVEEYSAKMSYNISSLDPNQWNTLYEKMRTDDHLFQSYYNHYHRYSDAFSEQCSGECRDSLLNSIPIYDPISCK